jgi:peptidyl-prolyl cis-trans isomerase C
MTTSNVPATGQPRVVRQAALPGRQRISVNGIVIAHAAIARETQNHPAPKPVDAWLAAARALVVRELLLQEAKRLAIEPDCLMDEDGRRETEDEAIVRQLVAREVATPTADETHCRRTYDNNRQRFRTPDLYEARHILIAAAPGDAGARAAARQKAAELTAVVSREPTLFAELAAVHSVCPSAEVGGNLGQIGPGQTVPEFEAALATMSAGTACPSPVESRYGFHIVILDRRIEGRQLPYEMVRHRIATWLDEKVRRTAIRQYISMIAGRAMITGIDMGVANSGAGASPLVQ